jgi:hypothetical protein
MESQLKLTLWLWRVAVLEEKHKVNDSSLSHLITLIKVVYSR